MPVAESRLPVGSSAKITVGRETSARAIATRCCCPPESSAGRWRRRSPRPTRSMTDSTHSASGFVPAIWSGSRMFSSAVSVGSRLKNWKMNPMLWRRSNVSFLSLSSAISVPSIDTVPDVGRSSPARMCMSVDLPDPDGPMTAANWPAGTSSETPFSASTAASPSP